MRRGREVPALSLRGKPKGRGRPARVINYYHAGQRPAPLRLLGIRVE